MGMAVGPRRSLLQLRRHPDEHVLPPVGGDELDADGQPSSSTCSGSEMAGWPVVLKAGVNAASSPARANGANGWSGFCAISPSRGGGPASVGVSRRSHAAAELVGCHHCCTRRR